MLAKDILSSDFRFRIQTEIKEKKIPSAEGLLKDDIKIQSQFDKLV